MERYLKEGESKYFSGESKDPPPKFNRLSRHVNLESFKLEPCGITCNAFQFQPTLKTFIRHISLMVAALIITYILLTIHSALPVFHHLKTSL